MKIEEGRGRILARESWKEVKKRVIEGQELSNWKEERKIFLEDRGK